MSSRVLQSPSPGKFRKCRETFHLHPYGVLLNGQTSPPVGATPTSKVGLPDFGDHPGRLARDLMRFSWRWADSRSTVSSSRFSAAGVGVQQPRFRIHPMTWRETAMSTMT